MIICGYCCCNAAAESIQILSNAIESTRMPGLVTPLTRPGDGVTGRSRSRPARVCCVARHHHQLAVGVASVRRLFFRSWTHLMAAMIGRGSRQYAVVRDRYLLPVDHVSFQFKVSLNILYSGLFASIMQITSKDHVSWDYVRFIGFFCDRTA